VEFLLLIAENAWEIISGCAALASETRHAQRAHVTPMRACATGDNGPFV